MMKAHAAVLVLSVSLTTACDGALAGGERNMHAQAAMPPETRTPDVPVPSAREILRAGWGGTERGRYDARRNVFVEPDPATREVHETGVWHRLTLTSGGQRYFTGLTSARQTEPAEVREPTATLSLGQATFVLEGGRWRAIDSGFVGELNVNASGNPATIDVDQSSVPPPYVMPDGRILLAIRMRDFAQGTSLESHAVLRFDPRGMAPGTARKRGYPNGGWSLVTVLPTGSNNDAACDGGAIMTCAADRGTLQFEPAGMNLPDIRVQRVGTEIVAPGKIQHLGPDNTLLYRFDPAQTEYVRRRER